MNEETSIVLQKVIEVFGDKWDSMFSVYVQYQFQTSIINLILISLFLTISVVSLFFLFKRRKNGLSDVEKERNNIHISFVVAFISVLLLFASINISSLINPEAWAYHQILKDISTSK